MQSPLDDDSGGIFGSSVDLCDGFYQFLAPWVASWFGLDVCMTAAEIMVEFEMPYVPVFDELTHEWDRLTGDDLVEGCFGGLAMGWSWALYFAHDALSDAFRAALRSLRWPTTLVGARDRPVEVSRRRAAAAPYVDNANTLSAGRPAGARLHRAIREELTRRGFILHDEHVDERNLEFLGMKMFGASNTLGHTAARTWRLFYALDDAASRTGLVGATLRILVGHVLYNFGLRPEFFSVLESVFWFIAANLEKWAPLDACTRCELIACRGLVFQSLIALDKPVARKVYCSDSSALGYELSVTEALPHAVLDAVRWQERWRHRELEAPETHRHPTSYHGQLAGTKSLADDDSTFVQWAAAAERYRSAGRRRVSGRAVDTFQPCRRPKTVALFNGVVPALPQTLLWRARYAPIVTGAWRNPDVIRCLESRASVAGLRHAAAVPELQDTIVLSIADDLAEICASDKGRSKDPALNSLLRRSAGLQLASGISWRRRHVESRRNPTDQGSRVADRGGLAPGELLRRTKPQVRRGYAVARSAAARACGLPHADFAAQMRIPTPKQPRSNPSPPLAAPFVATDNATPRSILTSGDNALPGHRRCRVVAAQDDPDDEANRSPGPTVWQILSRDFQWIRETH